MSVIANALLTATAVAPVLLVFAVMAYLENETRAAIVLAVICAALVCMSILLLGHIRRNLEKVSFQIKTIECADRDSIGLMLLYLVPLLRTSFSDLSWHIMVPATVILLCLIATGTSYHFNPLLNIFSWHFYKVGTKEGVTYLLITKRRIRNTANEILVGELTEHTVVEVEE